jgi:hypothetical protein
MHNKFLVLAIGMSIPCEGESDQDFCPNGEDLKWHIDFNDTTNPFDI